jgi:hypothetical protein
MKISHYQLGEREKTHTAFIRDETSVRRGSRFSSFACNDVRLVKAVRDLILDPANDIGVAKEQGRRAI